MRVFAFSVAMLFSIESGWCDDYKEVTDAAYCAGVLQRNVDLTKKAFGNLDVRSDEQHLALKVAFVQGALKQK
jgi:hypothetical protein